MSPSFAIDSVKLIAITEAAGRGVRSTVAAAERLASSAKPGTVLFQLRDNSLAWRERFLVGQQLARVAANYGHQLCVNDRLDLALSLGAVCVHLKRSSLDVQATRRFFAARQKKVTITQALHANEQLLSGEHLAFGLPDEQRPDGWVLSPVCQPRKGRSALGYQALSQVAKRLREPVFALGGVRSANALNCRKSGAQGVGAIGAFYEEPLALAEVLDSVR